MLPISYPDVYSNILYAISGFSIPIHLFGGYCILFKTPLVMKSVKWTLFNLHFWSAALDILLSLLAQPFLCSPFLAGFPLGILKFAPTDVLVLVLKTVFMLVPVSIISMFENRYFILFVENRPRRCWRYLRYPFLIINYLFGITYFIPIFLNVPSDQENARRILFNMYPDACEYVSDKNLVFVVDIGDIAWSKIRENALTFLLLSEIIVLAVVLRVKMSRALKTAISGDTLRMQKKFLRALNIQIAIPILLFFAPAATGILTSQQTSNEQLEHNLFVITTSFHGVLSTILMIYLQKCYRDVFIGLFGCRKPDLAINTVVLPSIRFSIA
ncbi:Serpentine Receptor, class H [Caenorhabditis elegans]|uniref:Serpentine Receptor, class H n=1 Tax=Caenorhabditis elegans TaxID=6239 RepID=Q9XXB0_CAEEL|nr:Serpentine Receptor, class H [Caenorhabditis elegans]CAA19566.1 Serpentine Receptor, class H [Caenorhabditis elegans]|eukprot:NP_507497.1 Serpentine Receptor, class H [Caenorhabditis elegans]